MGIVVVPHPIAAIIFSGAFDAPLPPFPSPGGVGWGGEREGGIHPSMKAIGRRVVIASIIESFSHLSLSLSLSFSLPLTPTRPTRQIERIIHSGEIAPARISLLPVFRSFRIFLP